MLGLQFYNRIIPSGRLKGREVKKQSLKSYLKNQNKAAWNWIQISHYGGVKILDLCIQIICVQHNIIVCCCKPNNANVLWEVFIRDKLAYVQVVTNCLWSVAQMCTREEYYLIAILAISWDKQDSKDCFT